MKFVRNLENIFEKYIEGFFNSKFSSGLQPVEIAKQLVRQMENERTVGISKIYVPNLYAVHLNSADYERIGSYGQTIGLELAQYLTEQARQKGYTISGTPQIEIFQDAAIGKGKFRVASSFSETIAAEAEAQELLAEDTAQQGLSETKVFSKLDGEWPRRSLVQGSLTVVEGPDLGLSLSIGATRINIGRRASNELPLTDMNTSRLQAYIVCEDEQHVLYDAKSLNGTYVNNQRVMCKRLLAGDSIKIGNTIIVYEVK